MTTAALAGFAIAALLTVMTPGMDTMLVLRHTLLGGRRAGFAATIGISTGCAIWGAASLAGLTALLTASQLAYDIVRIAGAAYLVWLGGSALWHSLRRNRTLDESVEPGEPVGRRAARSALRAGLLTNLLNPKVGVFFISLLPQFLPQGADSVAWGAALVAGFITIGTAWLAILVVTAARARRFLLRERVKRWLDRVTAAILIGLGVRLATER